MFTTTWLYGGLGSILVSLCIALGVQAHRLSQKQAEMDKKELSWSHQREELQSAALAAEEEVRKKEQAQHEKEMEASRAAQKSFSQLQLDLDSARNAGNQLRDRFSTLARNCSSSITNSGTATSPSGPTTGSVLADVFGRLDEAAGEIARFADQAVIDAKSCEAVH